jgi:hypothetical protein
MNWVACLYDPNAVPPEDSTRSVLTNEVRPLPFNLERGTRPQAKRRKERFDCARHPFLLCM